MIQMYEVTGMHCQGCVQAVQQALRGVTGIQSVVVTLQPPQARVEMPQNVPTEVMNNALKSAGDYRLLK